MYHTSYAWLGRPVSMVTTTYIIILQEVNKQDIIKNFEFKKEVEIAIKNKQVAS